MFSCTNHTSTFLFFKGYIMTFFAPWPHVSPRALLGQSSDRPGILRLQSLHRRRLLWETRNLDIQIMGLATAQPAPWIPDGHRVDTKSWFFHEGQKPAPSPMCYFLRPSS